MGWEEILKINDEQRIEDAKRYAEPKDLEMPKRGKPVNLEEQNELDKYQNKLKAVKDNINIELEFLKEDDKKNIRYLMNLIETADSGTMAKKAWEGILRIFIDNKATIPIYR